MSEDLFTQRKSLNQICTVPDKIISVYALEQHVWADGSSDTARQQRIPEQLTIEEFQINPVRPFLNDVFRSMAAPYKPERRDASIGQGFWIQAEFGSGKSHLLCFLATLALGQPAAWEIVQRKEKEAGRGKRDSLYRFWEEGLEAKSKQGKKGVFVLIKTLVGVGGGGVGMSNKGRRLSDYILEAAQEQIQLELGKSLSLYPVEILADRFLQQDLSRYRDDLRRFLRDPEFFNDDEFEELDSFIQDIQQQTNPDVRRSCGNKLWRFYTEYLKVHPHIAAETEDILKHMVETLLAEGYSGVLLVLDEVSLFMKDRDDHQRIDDEKTLVVLSNRLAKVHNLPVWTVCAAQQAIESKMGVKNIIADDRLKLVKLLEKDQDYYDIVLARVRTITDPTAIGNYYLYYKRGFTWPDAVGQQEFSHFFPFHKPALEVLRSITYELTTTRSAIHFMHQTLKHQVKQKGNELIRLWELFDEAVQYEEDPSGVHAGLVAIKTRRETEYHSYEVCRDQINGLTRGFLKVHREKAIKTLQTLFLYHIARTRQQGMTPEEIANSVLIERQPDATPEENIQHYETLTAHLRKELRQIVESLDEDNCPRYRFDPVYTGVDPRDEFRKARDEAETNEKLLAETWQHMLGLDEWIVRTRQMTLDLSNEVKSLFCSIAPLPASSRPRYQPLELVWQGRQVFGLIGMLDLERVAADNTPLPPIDTAETEHDFAVFVGTKAIHPSVLTKVLQQLKDPRVLIWTPGELTQDERNRIIDFAAYRSLIATWQGKDTDDATAIIHWVAATLETEMAKIGKIVDMSYERGRIDTLKMSEMNFQVAGELKAILQPLVERVLAATYESCAIEFPAQFVFRKEEGVKVINGIVKTGHIPKGAKPNQNISAAQNFGFGLKIMQKSAERELDVSDNPFVADLWSFIDDKLVTEGQSMKVETLYKNFMGIGGPKDYGLTRRMVQIYLLCLVQKGKVRVTLAPRSGLSVSVIDYATIKEIEFNTKVLDTLMEVQKVEKPEHWEALRPYAEKLLDDKLPVTQDESVIVAQRTRLKDLFKQQKEPAEQVVVRARRLFEDIGRANPYAQELDQVARLFATDISGDDDIAQMLYGLKEAFGSTAFDTNAASQHEVDDLANRLNNYRDMQHFLSFEAQLRTAAAYCNLQLPDLRDLRDVYTCQQTVSARLDDIQQYIDQDVKLKTELIGHIPPQTGETGTLGRLIHAYTTVYITMHETVLDHINHARRTIEDILQSDELCALQQLGALSVFSSSVANERVREFREKLAALFTCPSPSVLRLRRNWKNTRFIRVVCLSVTTRSIWIKQRRRPTRSSLAL